MRISSRAVIFRDNKIVLIYRKRDNMEYYVLPGGGQEEYENKEECIVRECKEELGINVEVIKQLYEVKGEGLFQNIFLCKWLDGTLGTGDEEEYDPNRKTGLQKPMLINIEEVENLNLVSPFIKQELINDLNKHGKEMGNDIKLIKEVK